MAELRLSSVDEAARGPTPYSHWGLIAFEMNETFSDEV